MRWRGMDPRNRQAAGSLLSASIIAGIVGGVVAGQPSIGFFVGIGAGLALVALWWLKDRRR
jgi:LytS/YehU family sensor histidine kinase